MAASACRVDSRGGIRLSLNQPIVELIVLRALRPPSSFGEVLEIHHPDGPPEEPASIVGIQDVKPVTKAGRLRLQPELASAETVKETDPGRSRLASQRGDDPAAHLRRRLVGEGHSENPVGANAALGDAKTTPAVRVFVLPVPAPASTRTAPGLRAASAGWRQAIGNGRRIDQTLQRGSRYPCLGPRRRMPPGVRGAVRERSDALLSPGS